MQKRIFYCVFGVCALLLVLANVFLFFSIKSFFTKQIISDMKKQAQTFLSVQNYDENSSKTNEFNTQNRFTLIDEKGVVLFDNFASNLENHLDRTEIKNTLKNGESVKIRYSQTLKQNLIYYAKAYKKANQTYIIRISAPQKKLTELLFSLAGFFACEIALLLVACFFIAKALAKWILRSIKNMNLNEPHKKDA